jgi:hypothetical protein
MNKMVRSIKILLVIILLSAIGTTIGVYLRGYTQQRWVEFIPEDRSFTALFPQSPAQEVEPAPLPLENCVAYLFTAVTRRGSYQLTYIDFPNGLENAEAILLTHTAARFGGALEMGEQPGDFLLPMTDGSVVFGRVLRARQRIYRLLVSRPDRQERDEEAQIFFDSFAPLK